MPLYRYRHLDRYREIVRVFARHGFGYLVDQAGLGDLLSFRERLRGQKKGPHERLTRGARTRAAFEELGPTFVKLGQLLSTRPDLVPADIAEDLEGLQDKVQTESYEAIRGIVEQDLGRPLEEVFASFEPDPVAAASIGQVHRAVLRSGEEVVVKVQRPEVSRQIETDLEIMADLASVLERRTRWGKFYRLTGTVDEFARTLRAELNYTNEAQNADRFRRNFAGESTVYIPLVYWKYTTPRVLTLERVNGVKISDILALERAGLSRSKIARNLSNAIFRQVLRDGFFHADPHPGNIFVGPGETIILMDFGMAGHLTAEMKTKFIRYVFGVVQRDPEEVALAILSMGVLPRRSDVPALRRDIERLQQKYGEIPMGEMEFGQALRETLAVAQRYQISIPTEYALLVKSLVILESLVGRLDPDLSLVDLAEPHARELLRERLSPLALGKDLWRNLSEYGRLSMAVPRQLNRILGLMEQGEWRFNLEHEHLDWAVERLGVYVNRLSVTFIVSSLIIGTSLIIMDSSKSVFDRIPIAEYSFILTVLLGVWVIISILRSEKD